MNKKDFFIVALATFCLTATLFTILPTRSALPYDPWADVSGPTQGTEDGTINMRDIAYVVQMFATSGDTTKNVSVTNWPQRSKVGLKDSWNVSWASDVFGISTNNYVSTEGFSRMYVVIIITNVSVEANWYPNITSAWLISTSWRDDSQPVGHRYYTRDQFDNDTISPTSIRFSRWRQVALESDNIKAIEVKGPYVCLSYGFSGLFNIAPTGWITWDVYYYFRNE
jgi:hypothetical protein